MAILIRQPAKPIAYPRRTPAPRKTHQYAKAGAWMFGKPESWESIANDESVKNVWDLILYNFQCRNPEEVNWCMQEFLGCTKSNDGKNFSLTRATRTPSFSFRQSALRRSRPTISRLARSSPPF